MTRIAQEKDAAKERQWAAVAIAVACVLNAIAGAAFYWARREDASFSPEAGIIIRIFMNFTFFALPLVSPSFRESLFPKRGEGDLWCWGVFGVLTVWTYFLAVGETGASTANLLYTGSGLLTAALAPVVSRQPFIRSHLWCAVGCIVGMALFASTRLDHSAAPHGLILGTASGLFSALAYLMVARGGRRFSPLRAVFYWSWCNLAVGLILLATRPLSWPTAHAVWFSLIIAGLTSALSQFLTAFAYQRTHASLLACLSYLTPAISLVIDLFLFHIEYSVLAFVGVGLTLIFSLAAPMMVFTGGRNGKSKLASLGLDQMEIGNDEYGVGRVAEKSDDQGRLVHLG